MLVNFNIDIDAVIADVEANPSLADVWLMDLWDFWQNHGIFCGGGTDSVWDKAERLLQSTLSHRTPMKALIDALVDANLDLNRRIIETEDVDFRHVSSCSDIGKFKTRSILTLMSNDRIMNMKKKEGEKEESLCLHCSDAEVVPWQYARGACLLEDFKENFRIPVHWTGRQIWDARFQPYVRYSDDIAVVDFAAVQDRNLRALSKFIKWTSDAATLRYKPRLKIYCKLDNVTQEPHRHIRNLFAHYDIQKRRLDRLTVCLFESVDVDGGDEKFPMDRWARFGEGTILSFHGLRILQDKITLGETCNVVEAHLAQKLREDEKALENNSNKIEIPIN